MIAVYYQSFYIIVILTLSWIVANKNKTSNVCFESNPVVSTNRQTMLLMCLVVIFIGTRPNHPVFADMMGYVANYEMEAINPTPFAEFYYSDDIRNEWMWQFIMSACARLGLPAWGWLTIVAWGYIGITASAIKRIFKADHTYIALLFWLGAFSTFSYAVNGMRNGLSFSVVLLALTYLKEEKSIKNLIRFGILGFIAYNIHHTALFPITCMLLSYFTMKDSKYAFIIWLLSIPASLFAHGYFEALLIQFSPDERLANNINAQYQSGGIGSAFSSTGFRWDFLLYSVMPIALGYYVIIKRKCTDKVFTLLLNTYLMCNSFWILVIRASFSNRFAYLSWFIYPIVLAYPLLEIEFTPNQRKWLSNILLAHIGFTTFMYFVYYS